MSSFYKHFYKHQLLIIKQQKSKYNQRGNYICALLLMSLLGKVCSGCFRQVFFIWGTGVVVASRVRQLVFLHSKECVRISFWGTQPWLS